jgi:hypothetical protein
MRMTSHRNIGGVLDLAAMNALYGRDQHQPTDTAVLVSEIQRLRATGLTARDIANTLRLGLGAVVEALRQDVA